MHDKHWPPTGTMLSLGHDVQELSEEQVLQVEAHDLHDLVALSRKVPAAQLATHFNPELT